MIMLRTTITTAVLLATSAAAQEPPPVEVDIVGGGVKSAITIAVPAMPSANGADQGLGRQIAEVIASDLRSTGLFTPIGPGGIGGYTYPQASNPDYAQWRAAGAADLVSGYVETRGDGRVTLACYVHDVTAGRPLANQGFSAAPATGAGRRISAPTWSIRGCRAKAPSLTPASSMSPKPGRKPAA